VAHHLTPDERELIFSMAHRITGTCGHASSKHEIIISNIVRRMQVLQMPSLTAYFSKVLQAQAELDYFVSAVTIHTTSWFRETPHFRNLEQWLQDRGSVEAGRWKLRVLSAGCSSGEEPFSLSCVLEVYRRSHPGFEYEVVGFDIDPISIQKAKNAIYKIENLSNIPIAYRSMFISRNRFGESFYAVDAEIAKRTTFVVGNLLSPPMLEGDNFDLIFCRNALIYFTASQVVSIVKKLSAHIAKNGRLTLGHCENVDAREFRMLGVGNSTYEFLKSAPEESQAATAVLVFDDSRPVRMWLSKLFGDAGIKVFAAENTMEANQLISSEKIDIITLDLHLGSESGLEWLKQQRQAGLTIPTILVTDVNAQEAPDVLLALDGIAEDYVNKATVGMNGQDLIDRTRAIVKQDRLRKKSNRDVSVGDSNYQRVKDRLEAVRPDIILVGASTGGTEAISKLISSMPPDSPPVVCVQHIPTEFAKSFYARLVGTSGLKAGLLDRERVLEAGYIYFPVPDTHVGVKTTGNIITAFPSSADKISSHRPSVDYLFRTASQCHGLKVMAFLLTGMGRDGAQGLLELRNQGAITLAQDELSSVVWGMPGEAVRLGAVQLVGNLRELRAVLMQSMLAQPINKKSA
jgi:chemotaxis response regulator CheB/chemotaxis methyl-accepting protein methylase